MLRLSFETARLIAAGLALGLAAPEASAFAAKGGIVEGTIAGVPASSVTVVYVETAPRPIGSPGSGTDSAARPPRTPMPSPPWRRDSMAAVIRQKDTVFVPNAVVVVAGGIVSFPNDDFISHNVFSLSSGAKFDLGIYPTGDSRSVKFTAPGEVDVFCNIHPAMIAKILVLKNDLFARVKPNGSFRIVGIPPGRHTVVAWSNTHITVRVEVEVKQGRPAKLSLSLRSRGSSLPHLNKDLQPYEAP